MPGTETAGRYHAETTLPAGYPVRNRGRETPGNAGISAHSTGERGDTRTGWLRDQSRANPSLLSRGFPGEKNFRRPTPTPGPPPVRKAKTKTAKTTPCAVHHEYLPCFAAIFRQVIRKFSIKE